MRSALSLFRSFALALTAASITALAGCGGESPPGGTGGGGSPVTGSTRPAGVVLCYTPLADQHPATLAFWDALRSGNRDVRMQVIADLEAAVMEHPDEEELELLTGLAYLWRVAEPLPSEAGDQAIIGQSAIATRTHVEKAYQLCPTDYRVTAWLGPILVNLGRALGDQAMIDQGMAVLQEGIDHYPGFVLFSKVLIYADRPADDPDFQQALDAIVANGNACGDIMTTTDPACQDTPHAAHNIEGSMVFLGDVFAKAGRKGEALSSYQRAMKVEEYKTWAPQWQTLLQDRIATIDDRLAAYQSGDPKKVPDQAWTSTYQCSICHNK